ERKVGIGWAAEEADSFYEDSGRKGTSHRLHGLAPMGEMFGTGAMGPATSDLGGEGYPEDVNYCGPSQQQSAGFSSEPPVPTGRSLNVGRWRLERHRSPAAAVSRTSTPFRRQRDKEG